MRTRLVLPILAALIVSAPAGATGINLNWGQACPGNAAQRLADVSDQCDGVATHLLVASLRTGITLPAVTSIMMEIDFRSADLVMPDYWRLESGGCREGSIVTGTDFSGYPTTPCKPFWDGAAQASSRWTSSTSWPSALGSLVVTVNRGTGPAPMNGTTEYYLAHFLIDGAHAGDCYGCLDPGIFCLTGVWVTQVDGTVTAYFLPEIANFATWQGGAGAYQIHGGPCGYGTPVPASSPTWGHIRTMYR